MPEPADVAHLLRRAGFGGTTAQINTLAAQPWADIVDGLLDFSGAPADVQPGFLTEDIGDWEKEYKLQHWWLDRMATSSSPLQEKLTLFWHGHFATSHRTIENSFQMFQQNLMFRRNALGNFGDLLFGIIRDPAMIRYLNNDRNRKGAPNENLAREIMELHTLGVHGGYTQEDVTNLACILTGWSTAGHADGRTGPGGQGVAVERFRFDPKLSDPRERAVLGFAFPETPARERFTRVDTALELLASHPSTARLICRKLAEHYCCTPAPEDLVEDLASTFIRTSGQMQEVLQAMAQHPAFWREATKPRIAHPLDFGVRMARVTGETNTHAVGEFLQSSGQGLFERPTPDGYPETDADSMSSNAMLQRWRLARRAEWQLAALVPGELRYVDRKRDEPTEQEARRIIDTVSLRLTGRTLGERSFAAASDVLSGTTGQRDERVRAVAAFVAQLPEAGMK